MMVVSLEEVPMTTRLLLAGLSGLALGLPYLRRPSALRTHFLVTLGSALFAVTGSELAEAANADALRVIQGVASGVGFVGAASVLKKGSEISGITEAASIWISAAIGIGIVLGQPLRTTGVAILVSIIGFLAELARETWIRHRRRRRPPR